MEPVREVVAALDSLIAFASEVPDLPLDVREPAAAEALDELEGLLGMKLPAAIRAVWERTDGLGLPGLLGEGLASAAQMKELWLFHFGPEGVHQTADRRFLPLGDDNGTHALLVLVPGHAHEGAVVRWDHDGDSLDELDDVIAPSFTALFGRERDRLGRVLAARESIAAHAETLGYRAVLQPWSGEAELRYRFVPA